MRVFGSDELGASDGVCLHSQEPIMRRLTLPSFARLARISNRNEEDLLSFVQLPVRDVRHGFCALTMQGTLT